MDYHNYCYLCGLLYNGGAEKVLPCGTRTHDVEQFEYIWDSSSTFGGVSHPHSQPPLVVKYPGSGPKVLGKTFIVDLREMPRYKSGKNAHFPFEYLEAIYDYLTRNGITENIQIIGTQKNFEAIKICPPGKPEKYRGRNQVEDLLPLKKLGYSISFLEINEKKGNPSYELQC